MAACICALYRRGVSWVWRTKKNGRTSYTTIGEWPEFSVKRARSELGKRTGRATPVNALTVKDALEEWFTEQIERKYRVTNNIRVYVDRSSEFAFTAHQSRDRAIREGLTAHTVAVSCRKAAAISRSSRIPASTPTSTFT